MPEAAAGPGLPAARTALGRARDPAAPVRPVSRRRGMHLLVGGGLLLAYVALAALGPWLAPYGENEQDLLGVLAPASPEHWLGTDQIGRDLLSRIVLGARFTLTAADRLGGRWPRRSGRRSVSSPATSADGSTPRLMAFVDLLLTMPNLILAIAIASVIGAGNDRADRRHDGQLPRTGRTPHPGTRARGPAGGLRPGRRRSRRARRAASWLATSCHTPPRPSSSRPASWPGRRS